MFRDGLKQPDKTMGPAARNRRKSIEPIFVPYWILRGLILRLLPLLEGEAFPNVQTARRGKNLRRLYPALDEKGELMIKREKR